MLTYVFMVLAVQSLALSAPSADHIGGEIANGDLSNYLVKPVGYLKYWFTRDVASKLLNLSFSIVEILVLWYLLQPAISISSNFLVWIFFFLSLCFAIVIYYFVSTCARFVAFWIPEFTWGLSFLILVFLEVFAGGIFPLNILPGWIYGLLQFTPFPYLVYFPIAIFSGKLEGLELFRILIQTLAWVIGMYYFTKYLWSRGMMAYQANGR